MHSSRIAGIGVIVALVATVGQARAEGELQEVTVDAQGVAYLRIGKPIARVAIADDSLAVIAPFPPDQLLITGKRPGITTATLWMQGGDVKLIRVEVTFPLQAILKGLRKAIPDGKITVQGAGLTVVLSGEVPSAEDIERAEIVVRGLAGSSAGEGLSVLNMLTVPGDQQVQLEVSFSEVSRSSLRQIGFNFWSKGTNGAGNGYAGGVLSPSSGVSSAATFPEVPNQNSKGTGFDALGNAITDVVPFVGTPLQGAFGFVFSSTLGGFPFSAALSLLSNKGFARILAEPTLVAMSGKHASFIAGGEFPVPLPSSLGQSSIEYRKFGIQLEFTPTVVGEDIQLDLSMTVSDVDFSLGVESGGTKVPGLTERRSATTIRLRDSQSFVIAGLLSDRVRSSVDKVPFLGDLPVLGALFRSSSYRREETELLVVVTAHRVRPLNERPQLPGETTTSDPGDLELFLLGRHESQKGKGHPTPRRTAKPVGAVGFQR